METLTESVLTPPVVEMVVSEDVEPELLMDELSVTVKRLLWRR